MRRFLLLLLSGAVILAIAGCQKAPKDVVAKVGKRYITIDDVNARFDPRWSRFTSFEDELQKKKDMLEQLVQDKLLLAGAYRAGLDKDSTVLAAIEKSKNNLLLNVLYQKEVVEKVNLTDDDLMDYYKSLGEEVRARHILVKDKSLADSLYEAIKSGADFAELAEKFSEDPGSKKKGGDLGFFTRGRMVKEFEDAAFALDVGEVSKPVKTQFGWHIIKLEEKRKRNQLPFEQQKDKLRQQLKRVRQQQLASAFVERVKEGAEVQLNPETAKLVIDRFAQDTSKTGLPVFSEEENSRTLMTYKYGSWTVSNFVEGLKKLPPYRRPAFSSDADLLDYCKNALIQELLVKYAEEQGIENSPEYKEKLTETIEREMLRKFKNDEIYSKAQVTDDELKSYYDEHQDEFMSPEQVNVREIQVATAAEAEKLAKQAKAGGDFAKLAEEHTLRAAAKSRGGELGFFTEARYPELFRVAKDMKPGDISDPIPAGGKYSIIQFIGKKEPEVKQFNLVKKRIENKLLRQKKEDVLKDWVEEHKKKIKVKIYEDRLASSIDKSKYEKSPDTSSTR